MPAESYCYLAIFARAPEVGKVKTRLAKTLGDEAAVELYGAMLGDVLTGAQNVASQMNNTQVVVFYTPEDAFARAENSLRLFWNGANFPQSDGDLGEKLFGCFDQLRKSGARKIVVIGSDAPDLPMRFLVQAFAELESHDLIFGPAQDGGFYLMGASCEVPHQMFNGVHWSNLRTLNDVLKNVKSASVKILPMWRDVDDEDDFRALRERLKTGASAAPQTYRVLERLFNEK